MRRNGGVGGRTTLRRLLLALVLVVLVAPPSPASAADVVAGFTWYADGTYVKSGPSGTVITAYATQARANAHFHLVASPVGPGLPCPSAGSVRLNPNIRVSSSTGAIGATTGAVNLPPGTYQICFLEQLYQYGANTATAPVHFTVS